jgi:regulator of RNase E activity RraA
MLSRSINDEPWEPTILPSMAPEIPPDILAMLQCRPDIVEELSDRFQAQLGIENSIDFGSFAVNRNAKLHIGVVVTVRYVPKCVPNNAPRLGHDRIAAALTPGAIVVVDAHGCEGSVLGGVGASILSAAGARAVVVDGYVRDLPEIAPTQLAVVARYAGIRSGRPIAQVVEIGGQVTLVHQLVASGDVGIMNPYGLISIPAWLSWNEVRRILTD